MQLFDPTFATRRWLKVGLTVGGALAGAVFGIALTRLGKVATSAPPATLANYAWNAALFGVMAGIVSPVIAWTVLRRVPLWRAVVEPLGYAVAGGAAAVLVGAPVLILILPPIALSLGFTRLARRYPEPPSLPAARTANER